MNLPIEQAITDMFEQIIEISENDVMAKFVGVLALNGLPLSSVPEVLMF